MRNLTKGLLIGLIVISFATNCFAKFRLESQNRIDKKGVALRINIYARKSLSDRLTVTSFMTVNENYGVGYAGLAYAPVKWIELEASFGLEQADSPWRIESSVLLGNPTSGPSALSIIEYGGSGIWYHFHLKYQTKQTAFGVMGQRFDGVGPRVDVNMPLGFGLWSAGLYDFEAKQFSSLVAVQRWF